MGILVAGSQRLGTSPADDRSPVGPTRRFLAWHPPFGSVLPFFCLVRYNLIMTEPMPPAVPDTSTTSTSTDPTWAEFLAWKAAGQPAPVAASDATPAPTPVPAAEPAPAPLTFDEITQGARDVLHAVIDRARYAAEEDVRKAKSAIDRWLAK